MRRIMILAVWFVATPGLAGEKAQNFWDPNYGGRDSVCKWTNLSTIQRGEARPEENRNLKESKMPLTKSKTKASRSPARKRNQGTSPNLETSQAAASDEVLTLAEAAAYSRVSPEEVVRLVGPSGLPGRRIGDQWRFLRSALQAWLATPPRPSSREALLSLAGAWKDDPHLEELRQQINAQRERVEDSE